MTFQYKANRKGTKQQVNKGNEIIDPFILSLPRPHFELHYNYNTRFSPWANGLLRNADASLGWNLHVRFIKVPVAAGVHDNYCNCPVLHHVKKFLSCDATSWHRSYQMK